jgi:RNA polymerase sigma factor (sigma-70 family)
MESPRRPANPEELLRHSAWMRDLARVLVGDRASGDDLVQDAFVASLRHPPEGEPRPWFRRVMQNLNRMRARGEIRRLAREAGVASEATAPSPEQLLERAETERLLAALVCELAEPYRATLVLRYYEGHSAAEIAEMQGVPAGTVRWRLKQAVDELRRRLDEKHNGDRRAWSLALLPIAGPLRAARKLTKPLLFGTAVAAVGAAAVVAVVMAPGGNSPTGSRPAERAAAEAPRLAPPSPVVAVPKSPQAENGRFLGHVVSKSTGEGVPGAELTFHHASGLVESATTDEHGQFDFRPAEPGRIELRSVMARGFIPDNNMWSEMEHRLFDARPGVRLEGVRLYLSPAHEITVVTLGMDGAPVPGVHLLLFDGSGFPAPQGKHVTDEKGEATVIVGEKWQVVGLHKKLMTARAPADRTALAEKKVVLRFKGERPARHEIAGIVLDPAGRPVDGAIVHAQMKEEIERDPLKAQTTTHADGRFRFEGLPDQPHLVTATQGELAAAVARDVPAGQTDLTLRLVAGGSVRGVVRDAQSGKALNAFVALALSEDVARRAEDGFHSRAIFSPDGAFELRGLPPGNYLVNAMANGKLPCDPQKVTVRAGETPSVTLSLESGAKLRGRVTDAETHQPIAHAIIHFRALSFEDPVMTGADGRFELEGVGTRRRMITVTAEGHHARVVNMLRGGEDLEIALKPARPGEKVGTEILGMGVQLKAEPEGLRILEVYPNTGASDARIKPGDLFIAVEGRPLAGNDERTGELFQGAEGSTLHVTVRRPTGETQDVQIIRRYFVN